MVPDLKDVESVSKNAIVMSYRVRYMLPGASDRFQTRLEPRANNSYR